MPAPTVLDLKIQATENQIAQLNKSLELVEQAIGPHARKSADKTAQEAKAAYFKEAHEALFKTYQNHPEALRYATSIQWVLENVGPEVRAALFKKTAPVFNIDELMYEGDKFRTAIREDSTKALAEVLSGLGTQIFVNNLFEKSEHGSEQGEDELDFSSAALIDATAAEIEPVSLAKMGADKVHMRQLELLDNPPQAVEAANLNFPENDALLDMLRFELNQQKQYLQYRLATLQLKLAEANAAKSVPSVTKATQATSSSSLLAGFKLPFGFGQSATPAPTTTTAAAPTTAPEHPSVKVIDELFKAVMTKDAVSESQNLIAPQVEALRKIAADEAALPLLNMPNAPSVSVKPETPAAAAKASDSATSTPPATVIADSKTDVEMDVSVLMKEAPVDNVPQTADTKRSTTDTPEKTATTEAVLTSEQATLTAAQPLTEAPSQPTAAASAKTATPVQKIDFAKFRFTGRNAEKNPLPYQNDIHLLHAVAFATDETFKTQNNKVTYLKNLTNAATLASTPDADGNLPIHTAVAKGNVDYARWLGQAFPDTLNVRNKQGFQPIHLALLRGDVNMVYMLLQLGINLDAKVSFDGQELTLLEFIPAAISEKVGAELVEYFARDLEFAIALETAIQDDNAKRLKELLSQDPNMITMNYRMLDMGLHMAAANGSVKCMTVLLQATRKGHHNVIKSRFSLTAKNGDGEVPFAVAMAADKLYAYEVALKNYLNSSPVDVENTYRAMSEAILTRAINPRTTRETRPADLIDSAHIEGFITSITGLIRPEEAKPFDVKKIQAALGTTLGFKNPVDRTPTNFIKVFRNEAVEQTLDMTPVVGVETAPTVQAPTKTASASDLSKAPPVPPKENDPIEYRYKYSGRNPIGFGAGLAGLGHGQGFVHSGMRAAAADPKKHKALTPTIS